MQETFTSSAAEDERRASIELSDHESQVSELGQGPPLVLIHPLGLDHRVWLPMMRLLAKDGRRAIAYDVRGHGAAASAAPTASVEQLADDLVHLLDHLEVPACGVVGTSMGVAVALQLAVSHPDRVQGLAVIAGLHRGFPALRERAAAAKEYGLEAQFAPTLERWFGATSVQQDSQPVRYARTMLGRFQLPHWVASWEALAELDVVDELSRITMPTIVIAGEKDASVPPAVMTEMADLLPAAERLEVVEAAPHLLVATHPAEVASLVDQLPR